MYHIKKLCIILYYKQILRQKKNWRHGTTQFGAPVCIFSKFFGKILNCICDDEKQGKWIYKLFSKDKANPLCCLSFFAFAMPVANRQFSDQKNALYNIEFYLIMMLRFMCMTFTIWNIFKGSSQKIQYFVSISINTKVRTTLKNVLFDQDQTFLLELIVFSKFN